MHTDFTQPGSAALEARRPRWSGLLAGLLLAGVSACSSNEGPAPQTTPGECDGRAEFVTAGMTKTSEQGYTFELSRLEPSLPVQSDGAPGNRWTVTVTDPSGARVTGATLSIHTDMPEHFHPRSAAGVEVETDDGSYDVAELVFPMPGLYQVSLLLTPTGGEIQTATILLCLDVASG